VSPQNVRNLTRKSSEYLIGRQVDVRSIPGVQQKETQAQCSAPRHLLQNREIPEKSAYRYAEKRVLCTQETESQRMQKREIVHSIPKEPPRKSMRENKVQAMY